MSAIGSFPGSVVSSRSRVGRSPGCAGCPASSLLFLKKFKNVPLLLSLALEDLCFVLELVDELRHVGHLPSPRALLGRGQKEEADLRAGVHPEGIRRDHLHLLLL